MTFILCEKNEKYIWSICVAYQKMEKHLCVWTVKWTVKWPLFFNGPLFSLENKWYFKVKNQSIVRDRNSIFQAKIRIWKTYPVNLKASQYLKTTVIKMMMILLTMIFKIMYYVIKYINIWMICILPQWTIIFQMTNAWCYRVMPE